MCAAQLLMMIKPFSPRHHRHAQDARALRSVVNTACINRPTETSPTLYFLSSDTNIQGTCLHPLGFNTPVICPISIEGRGGKAIHRLE